MQEEHKKMDAEKIINIVRVGLIFVVIIVCATFARFI